MVKACFSDDYLLYLLYMKKGDEKITTQQRAILDFISITLKENGLSPTIREISEKFGFASPRSVTYHLDKLEDAKLIKRNASKRGIRLTTDDGIVEKTVLVPLVGSAPCGGPVWAEQNIEEYYSVSEKLVKGKENVFFVRATGDSMDREGINEGDLLLVSANEPIDNGNVIIGLIDGEVTVKKFYQSKNRI